MLSKLPLKIARRIIGNLQKLTSKMLLMRKSDFVGKLIHLPDFPSSAASQDQFIDITLRGARENYTALADFVSEKTLICSDIEDFHITFNETKQALRLGDLFKYYGSDKASTHNYHFLYSKLMNLETTTFNILEIGLGSNNTDTPSNMGKYGKPGASLRAWRDFKENIYVTGADIDERILFQEDRIETYQLDQTLQFSWDQFLSKLGKSTFDLIIDDGLHAPLANLLTVRNLISKLNPGGVLVIEDIGIQALPIWRLFQIITEKIMNVEIVKSKMAYLVLVRQKNNS